MVISDLDYLCSVAEIETVNLNGGQAIATGTGFASSNGSSAQTSIFGNIRTIRTSRISIASSSVTSIASSVGGDATSYSSSSSSASI